jgi:hypothetical protein
LSSGISPNPCNKHGDSLLHTACRLGTSTARLLKLMLENGCSVQISDDQRRTALHSTCATDNGKFSFETVELILKQDICLIHMLDAHGALPLSYIPKQHWPEWIEFLDSIKEHYWPKRNLIREGEQEPTVLAREYPNSRPLPDPHNALSIKMARSVASGIMHPQEIKFQKVVWVDASDDETCVDTDDDHSINAQ